MDYKYSVRMLMVGLSSYVCVLAATLPTTACAVVQSLSFERPGIDLREIQITGVGLSGGSLNLVLDVYNPNGYSLRTLRVQTAIDIEDTHFGDVELEREITLPANDTATVQIPMTFTWSGVGAAARGLLQRGSVGYVMDSKILVDTPLGEQTLDFRNHGTVPLKQIFQ
jgi:LEA14-like dessication related protein